MNVPSSEVEQHGFSILPEMFSHNEMKSLVREVERSGLRRSKAGIRHALQNDGVQNLARDPRLSGLAGEIFGREAIPFRATYSINHRKQTG